MYSLVQFHPMLSLSIVYTAFLAMIHQSRQERINEQIGTEKTPDSKAV